MQQTRLAHYKYVITLNKNIVTFRAIVTKLVMFEHIMCT